MALKLYSVQEVAEILDLTRQTVYKMVNNGEIVASKVGKEWKIREQALEDLLDRTSNVKVEKRT